MTRKTLPFLLLIGALFFLPWNALGRGGGGCIEEGAKIEMLGGGKAVETLHTGDAIACAASGTVCAVSRVQPDEFVQLRWDSGSLHLTAEHPVAVASGVYKMAGNLHAGDKVLVWNKSTAALESTVLLEASRVKTGKPAFNLLVNPGGCYLAEGLLVHNKGCFLPDTPVSLADGSVLPISQIQPGQHVMAFDTNGVITEAVVREVLTAQEAEYFIVKTDKAELKVTGSHPFYVGKDEFRALEALNVGDSLFAYDGDGWHEQKIISKERVVGPVTVYNLQTEEPHTYFAAGVAVHNKGGGGGGGGGRSSGGAFRYGGGSTGGSGSSSFGCCCAGIIIMLVVFYFLFFKKTNKTAQDLDFVYERKDIADKSEKTLKLLAFLSKQDEALRVEFLQEWVTDTFLTLQKCWGAREYDPMLERMTRGLYKQHCRQLEGMKRAHEINRIEGVEVESVDLVHINYTHKPEDRYFTALITAKARDYYEDDRNGDFLRGDNFATRFQEFWTFLWRDGKWLLRDIEQTRESDVLKRENFFEQFTDAQVEHIYQDKVEMDGPVGNWLDKDVAIRGVEIERMLNFLVQTDKYWNREAMVARVIDTFTDLYMAREVRDLSGTVVSMLFPDLSEALGVEIANEKAQGVVFQFRNFCVRKVELIQIRNRADDNEDEFDAYISAHAQRTMVRNGEIVLQEEYVTPFEEYWTFGRLDGEWKLKEILPHERGREAVRSENVDEDSCREQLQWYYTKKRA